MTELSPQAQAVLDAAGRKDWYRNDDIATALRAAADQVVPVPIKTQTPEEHWALLGVKYRLLAIADELESDQ